MLAELRRFLGEWVVPPGYVRLGYQIMLRRSTRLTTVESSILARNAKFRNLHAGKRCFVIGNGPSLNQQDLSPLGNEITIVMNWFNRNPIIDRWEPTFFCMEEPPENIKRLGLSTFLEKIEAQAYFFQIGVKEMLDEHKLLDVEKVYYFKLGGAITGYQTGKHMLDLTRPIPGAWTTAQTAIMIALYMGCSPIYLIGLDQDWLAERYAHFYSTSSGEEGKGELNTLSYKAKLERTLHIWNTYESLQNIARRQSVTIYNATAGGFLDVFPRVEFEGLFPARNK